MSPTCTLFYTHKQHVYTHTNPYTQWHTYTQTHTCSDTHTHTHTGTLCSRLEKSNDMIITSKPQTAFILCTCMHLAYYSDIIHGQTMMIICSEIMVTVHLGRLSCGTNCFHCYLRHDILWAIYVSKQQSRVEKPGNYEQNTTQDNLLGFNFIFNTSDQREKVPYNSNSWNNNLKVAIIIYLYQHFRRISREQKHPCYDVQRAIMKVNSHLLQPHFPSPHPSLPGGHPQTWHTHKHIHMHIRTDTHEPSGKQQYTLLYYYTFQNQFQFHVYFSH